MKGNEYFTKKEMKLLCAIYGKQAVKYVIKENRKLDKKERRKKNVNVDGYERLLHAIFDK